MKWFFRFIGLIILSFIGLCIAGYFMPATQTIERSIEIDAYADEVFPHINNLQNYSSWSPLYAAISDAQMIYGGADDGLANLWPGKAAKGLSRKAHKK